MKLTGILSAAVILVSLFASSCSELQSDLPPASTPVDVHPAQWTSTDPAAAGTHGKYLKTKNWNDTECKTCHGGAYSGGSSGVACFTCHNSYPHSAKFSAGGHTSYLRGQLYPLNTCKTCHGPSYAGGSVVNESCMASACHVDRNGAAKSPEACNTCHGDFRAPASDALSAAPPRSIDGSTANTAPGVGAHQKHLATGTLGKSVKCAECHRIPAVWDAPGHIDADVRAEVIFTDTLAGLTTGDGTLKPVPSYDRSTSSCNNVYCHGNWRIRRATSAYQFAYTDSAMVGAKYAPRWTAGSAGATCGLCHAIPPGGHSDYASSACGSCHTGVVDGAGNIADKSKHVNGKVIIFSVETPFR